MNTSEGHLPAEWYEEIENKLVSDLLVFKPIKRFYRIKMKRNRTRIARIQRILTDTGKSVLIRPNPCHLCSIFHFSNNELSSNHKNDLIESRKFSKLMFPSEKPNMKDEDRVK